MIVQEILAPTFAYFVGRWLLTKACIILKRGKRVPKAPRQLFLQALSTHVESTRHCLEWSKVTRQLQSRIFSIVLVAYFLY